MYALPPQPEVLRWGTLPFFLNLPLKVIWQFWGLFRTLMYDAPPAKWIIIQVGSGSRHGPTEMMY